MKRLLHTYYFLFYTLYSSFNKSWHIMSAQLRATVGTFVVVFWLVMVIGTYVEIALIHFFEIREISSIYTTAIPGIIVGIATLYYSIISKKWEKHIQYFEQWSHKKRTLGKTIVWISVILIFVNIFIAVEWLHSLQGK